jgi:hypothetical protein
MSVAVRDRRRHDVARRLLGAAIVGRVVAGVESQVFVKRGRTKREDESRAPALVAVSLEGGRAQQLAGILGKNVLEAANAGRLLTTCTPGLILWRLSSVARNECPKVFSALKSLDPSLDGFALAFLSGTWDSSKGQRYSLPEDRSQVEAYCPLEDFKKHAVDRLADPTLTLPTLTAWRSVNEEKSIYGVDGSYPRH